MLASQKELEPLISKTQSCMCKIKLISFPHNLLEFSDDMSIKVAIDNKCVFMAVGHMHCSELAS